MISVCARQGTQDRTKRRRKTEMKEIGIWTSRSLCYCESTAWSFHVVILFRPFSLSYLTGGLYWWLYAIMVRAEHISFVFYSLPNMVFFLLIYYILSIHIHIYIYTFSNSQLLTFGMLDFIEWMYVLYHDLLYYAIYHTMYPIWSNLVTDWWAFSVYVHIQDTRPRRLVIVYLDAAITMSPSIYFVFFFPLPHRTIHSCPILIQSGLCIVTLRVFSV